MRGAAKQLLRQTAALQRGLQRSYASAAAELAVAEDSVFLKYGSPIPQTFNYGASIATLPETRVTTLSNGLRVATETVPFAETATVGVWIDAGSRYETEANNGTAHFLEHMFFKGTKERNVKQLEVEIENMGGHLNAYTSREQTCYYAKTAKADVGKAVDVLADILQNSSLSESAVERERDVILREMQEVESMPEEVIFDHLHATAFQWTPLGRTILGSADNVRSITRQNLVDYIKQHYTASRMVLSAAGAVDHDALVKLAEAKFGGLPTGGLSTVQLVKEGPAVFTGSEVRYRDPDQPVVQFALAFEGASWTDPDAVPLMVLQTMIGAWDKNAGAGENMASPLAQRVAINDLASSYMAFNTNYKDTGLFGVYAVTDKLDKMQDLSWCILNEMTRQCYSASEDQVTRAKTQLKTSILFGQDSTTGVAEDIGRQLLVYGRRVPKAEMFARIDAVDSETIQQVADRFVYDQDIALAASGDTQFLPDYNWLRRRTYWLRY